MISGILKLMDPVGAGLVMEEYFKFLHLGFLSFASKALGVVFALLEAVVGAALVTGVWRKPVLWVAAGLMALFTLLTALLSIFNPSMDCGCFGEAVHLTHIQSLIKNIVLDALIVVAMLPYRNFGVPKKLKYGSFSLVALSLVAFSIYSLLSIPLQDFTNYKYGATLASSSDAALALEPEFVYEKDGVECIFSLETLPDSTWTFLRTKSVDPELLSSLPMLPVSVDGVPADSLAVSGKVLVVSIYDPSSYGSGRVHRVNRLLSDAYSAGLETLVLRPSGFDGASSDYRSLVGLNRSNGGATLLEDGVIIHKWSNINLPSKEKLDLLSAEDPMEAYLKADKRGKLMFQGFLLYTFAILLLL